MYHSSYLAEVAAAYGSEDLVYGGVGGQGTVEDVELSLEPLRNVVPAPSWVDHGSDDLDVHDVSEFSGLLQVIESLHLHHLASDLIGHLHKHRYIKSATKKFNHSNDF